MEPYEAPKMEVIIFEDKDIVTITSSDAEGGEMAG